MTFNDTTKDVVFYTTTSRVRTRLPPSLRLSQELVLVSAHMTVMNSNRRPVLVLFHILPGFMNPVMCRERTTPTYPPFRLNTGSQYRSLTTGSLSGTSNLCLRSHVALNSDDDVPRRILWFKTMSFFASCVGAKIPALTIGQSRN